ncbi:MAG TPA: hypothetical protein VNR40_14070 [Steroidobacter sp.]|nr:hypothetical protein [Steroidobacter sp.]
MLVESLTTLGMVLDRLIQLVDRKEKLNREVFTDFIEPLMTDFDAVHRDYIESFGRYLEMLDDQTIPFNREHPIFDEIKRNRISAQHLQTRVRALGEALDYRDERLSPLIFNIWHYFRISNALAAGEDDNGAREPPRRRAKSNSPRAVLLRMTRTRSARAVLAEKLHLISFHRASTLDSILEHEASDNRHALAQMAVLDTAGNLQEKYAAVYRAFAKLKQHLLSPI